MIDGGRSGSSSALVDPGGGNDLMRNAVGVNGGRGHDTITGSTDARGGTGNDSILGDGQLFGDAGRDTLEGSTTDDTLVGGDGNDELRFAFDAGDDILRGQAGNDVFVLTEFDPVQLPPFTEGFDLIQGFVFGQDAIDVRIAATVDTFDDLSFEQDGADTRVLDPLGYNLVVVKNRDATDFTQDDFIF